jgi:hypothetical protein
MTSRIIITGKNNELPRKAFSHAVHGAGRGVPFPARQAESCSGVMPEAAAGGTRALILPPLGVSLAEVMPDSVLLFGADFGLGWAYP